MYKNSMADMHSVSLDQICYLVEVEIIEDGLKNQIEHRIPRRVFCGELPVYSSEISNAGNIGIKAEKLIAIDFEEYNNEKYLIYNSREYTIYRTYRVGDYIELYCGERIGNENVQNNS